VSERNPVSAAIGWAAALAAGLVAFLLWRWMVGPSLHWVETLIGCALFAVVAMLVRRAAARRQG
jgi:high-affinity Fe2+/Pb2+ permease